MFGVQLGRFLPLFFSRFFLILLIFMSAGKKSRHLWSVLPLSHFSPPLPSLHPAPSSSVPAAGPHSQGWSREQQYEWKRQWVETDRVIREAELTIRQTRKSSDAARGTWMINSLSPDTPWPGPAEPSSRLRTSDDHNTNMWSPQDAGRHLHKAAPILAWLTLTWGSMWDTLHVAAAAFTLSPSLSATLFGHHQETPHMHP